MEGEDRGRAGEARGPAGAGVLNQMCMGSAPGTQMNLARVGAPPPAPRPPPPLPLRLAPPLHPLSPLGLRS